MAPPSAMIVPVELELSGKSTSSKQTPSVPHISRMSRIVSISLVPALSVEI